MAYKNRLLNLFEFYKTPLDEALDRLNSLHPNSKWVPKSHIEIIQKGFWQLWDNTYGYIFWFPKDVRGEDTLLWPGIKYLENYVFNAYVDDEYWTDEIECNCNKNTCQNIDDCPSKKTFRYEPPELNIHVINLYNYVKTAAMVHQDFSDRISDYEILFILFALSGFARFRIDFRWCGSAREKEILRKSKKVISTSNINNFGKMSFFTESDIELLINKSSRYLDSKTNVEVTTKKGIFNIKDHKILDKDISFAPSTDSEEVEYFLNHGRYSITSKKNFYDKEHVKIYLENHKDYMPTRFCGESFPYTRKELGYE